MKEGLQDSPEQAIERWRSSDRILPEAYIINPNAWRRSLWLIDFVKRSGCADGNGLITEIGCGPCRNLMALRCSGYDASRLHGWDISERMIQYSTQFKTCEGITLNLSSDTDNIVPKESELIFTMACLQHVPPVHRSLLSRMCKSEYILTIEDELSIGDIQYGIMCRTEFEHRGRVQIWAESPGEQHGFPKEYIARLFM